MKKMNRKSGAVGFALYLDLLEQLPKEKNDYDVEVLLIYDENCSNFEIAKTVDSLIKSGKTVTTQKCIPQKLRYKEIIDLRKEGYNA
jgi:ATP phosphoribosyltransferase regulatory subunit